MCRQHMNANTQPKLHISVRLMWSHEGSLAKCTHTENSPAASNIIFSIGELLQKEETCCLGESSASACICPYLDWGPSALSVILQRGAARKFHCTHPPPEFLQATPKEPNPFQGKMASRRKIWCYHQKCLWRCTPQQISYPCDDTIKA